MNSTILERMGLTVREGDGRTEADLEITGVSIVNPLTRTIIERVTFTSVGDRLVVLDPPEMLGIEPIRLSAIEKSTDLEDVVLNLFNETILHVERRSADLNALGLSPSVDPETLRLSAQVPAGELVFTIVADRRGHFRVLRATKAGQLLDVPEASAFELSEFRERGALVGYLAALVGEAAEPIESTVIRANPLAPRPEPAVSLSEILGRFGGEAVVPPASPLQFLVELRVDGQSYRFAAARVMGRAFRGLLAGAQGKVWADRFELDEFPGVAALVGKVLKVPPSAVEILDRKKGS